ncbi:MAG: chaperone protein, partial [Proteobacteria bacterium]
MVASKEEKEEIISTDASYQQVLNSDDKKLLELEMAYSSGDHRRISFVQDKIFTEYLRRKHAERSVAFIERFYKEGEYQIAWQGTPFHKWVQSVIRSHELSAQVLRDTEKWPRDALIRDQRINVQYLSLLLRLGDILDLDPERTPRSLLDHITFESDKSITEWRKHLSMIGWDITPEHIRFEAECNAPEYERALREFIAWIEVERRDSVLLSSSYRDDISKIYRFDLTEPVTDEKVHSDGSYIYSDLRFSINYRNVLKLLMGERLYGDPRLALRELVQNAIDAVRYRIILDGVSGFTPQVIIRLTHNELVIEDEGIGMDESIFKNYFVQVGKSYYNSAEARNTGLNFDATAEFGIGVLSVFMIAETLSVESRRRPDNPLNPPTPIFVEIPTAYEYFVSRPTERTRIGTTIRLLLKEGHPFTPDNLAKIVQSQCPFVEVPIIVETDLGSVQIGPSQSGACLSSDNDYKLVEVLFTQSDSIEGAIWITQEKQYIERARGVLAQRGFAITGIRGDREEEQPPWAGLFPD